MSARASRLTRTLWYDLRLAVPERLLWSGALVCVLIATLVSSMWWLAPLVLMAPILPVDKAVEGPMERSAVAVVLAAALFVAAMIYLSAEHAPNRIIVIALAVAIWLMGWAANQALALSRAEGERWAGIFSAIWFGLVIFAVWEVVTWGLKVPSAILPRPSEIFLRLRAETETLWLDFKQTILKGALSGFVIGCGAAFLTAVAVDRSPFLTRGVLPVGNFLAAMPIIGVAPIMVMWFGFDWQSKAAVVVVMVFFPMLVNTVAGLKAADAMQLDLMRTYAASYWQTLFKLRLPSAMPFIFNGLKISTTLALIGAIVAEFFGSPTQGMGFRISTAMGRLGLDMVWAEIVVAALAGSGAYGLVSLIEKRVTFWHPSQRN